MCCEQALTPRPTEQPGLHGASRVLIVDGVSEADSEIGHVRPSVHLFVDILSIEATDL